MDININAMKSRIGLLGLMLTGLLAQGANGQFDYLPPKMDLNHSFGKTGGGAPSKHGQSLKQHRKNRKAAKAQKQARRKQRK